MDRAAFVVGVTVYVRPGRSLALGSVRSGVGGPGAGLWSGGWHLGVRGDDLLAASPEVSFWTALESLHGMDRSPMTLDARRAWMSTWKPSDGVPRM